MSIINGTNGNDYLFGTTEPDTINGLDGDDYISAGEGDDTVAGGAGIDTIYGGLGNDWLEGGAGYDLLDGGEGDDHLISGEGTGELRGGNGADYLDASAGGSAVLYSDGSPLYGMVDFLRDHDVLVGSAELDLIYAGYGDDIDGGGGDDVLTLDLRGALTGLTVDFTPLAIGGQVVVGGGTIQSIEVLSLITASGHDDAITLFSSDQGFPPVGAKLDGQDGNDLLIGGNAGDRIWGGFGTDSIHGGAGNDLLSGGAGDIGTDGQFPSADYWLEPDSLFGDAGDDTLQGGVGDSLDGGTGQDRMLLYLADASEGVTIDMALMSSAQGQALLGGTIANVEGMEGLWLPNFDNTVSLAGQVIDQQSGNYNTFYGGNAIDTLIGSDYGDRFDGQGGNDHLAGMAGNDGLSGGVGDDFLDGGDGNDGLSGGAGADELRGGTGDDQLDGGDGDDVLVGGPGRDNLIGGSGIDTASYADSAVGVTVHISPTSQAEFDASVDVVYGTVEIVEGSAFDDVIGGNLVGNRLLGGAGNDLLFGRGGDDDLDGGSGADSMLGGTGNDSYWVDDAGDVVVEAAGEGRDSVGVSIDYYLGANVEWLLIFDGTGDRYAVGNELDNAMVGNEGANLLIGHGGSDTLLGMAGGDVLFGGEGIDGLFGGAGIDYLIGGADADLLDGGEDADQLWGEDGDDVLSGGSSFHTDIMVGGAGNDVLDGISGQANPDYDLMDGGAGDDTYRVDTGDDLTFEAADGGTDTVYANVTVVNAGVYLWANVENLVLEGNTAFGVGNELDNHLTGSDGANWLLGGAGNDLIAGGLGDDVLFGEAGADVFDFRIVTGADLIGDFEPGTDKIDVGSTYSWQYIVNAMHEYGGSTAIDLGGGAQIIVLAGIAIAQLQQSDFLFG